MKATAVKEKAPIENNLTVKNVVREIPYCDYKCLMSFVENCGRKEIADSVKETVENWCGNSDGLREVLESDYPEDAMRRYLASHNLMFVDENGGKYGIGISGRGCLIDEWEYIHPENLTYVLIINCKGKFTLNGKVISKKAAMEEFDAAELEEKFYRYGALLYIDKNVIEFYKTTADAHWEFARNGKIRIDGAVKIVDFGRDEIPYVNAKVDAIIAEYRAKAN